EVHEAKEHSLARFTQQWAETQALLGDRVALYQVHSLTADSPLFDDRPLLDALAALAAGGRVRVGFSTTGPAQAATIERGLALEVEGQRVFTAVQSTWNLLEPAAGAALAAAHRDGALVLVKETLANGRLAVPERVPAPLAAVAERHGTTPDAVALAAVLAQPWAGTVLVGPAGPDQLAANLRAAAVALTADDQAQLAALAEPPATYWHHRSTLPWR
ncbi:MAG TPA: aldo/keto reductase, partial [Acidimicrobiales bacterium]